MKVFSLVGARPQFIKAFPISNALESRSHEEVIVHTGQHYDADLSDVFFDELDLPKPDHHLGVGSGSHGYQTGEIMTDLGAVVKEETPDVLLAYGDTNSTLAGALVGSKTDPILGHVEAGLRSGNWAMPEETNRVLTDHCADLLFAPTERAVDNLRAEGIGDRAHETGDVMFDAMNAVSDLSGTADRALGEFDLSDGHYVLATIHRVSNTQDEQRLEGIVDGLVSIPNPVVFPMHPRTQSALRSYGLWERASEELDVIDPVGYLTFIDLVEGAQSVVTDSGGVQKEAFYLETPCVTVRDETEWIETVEYGGNELVDADESSIRRAVNDSNHPGPKPDLYGGGRAAEAIVDVLESVVQPPAPEVPVA